MRILKKILFILTFLVVAFHAKLKAQKQYYNNTNYKPDTCDLKYNDSIKALVLYSRNSIDTLYLNENEKAIIDVKGFITCDDQFITKDSRSYFLIISQKAVLLKNKLKGFNNDSEYKYKSQHFSHASHMSHASHYSQVK